MKFGHRPPTAVKFAAYSASTMDVAMGTALVVMGVQEPGGLGFQIAGLVLISMCWLPPWLLLGVCYQIEGGKLTIRRGPAKRSIALDSIDEARIANPAPGVEGVLISYRRGMARATEGLQPEDSREFLRHLQMDAGQLKPAGEGVLRRRA